ncbi:MAG: hypothetical protein SCAL_000814 [Candidatus Syntrophoarchaeum caldarius]|uniref:Uncharacterized protein n=1 Tax=Candidatus Syntropharchaeum caldarium TaxID=1838285 RepID=A0A1F2PAV8_9EURY|nr:MAG: hypothetical protein SCAL_000814 [Candidatus Syntrophoarchaeum caldarius]
MDLLTGKFIYRDERMEDHDVGKIIYDLIMDSFTGYIRVSNQETSFVDKYLLLENGKIIGSSEEGADYTYHGWKACKKFLSIKKGWFDVCMLNPSDMSKIKEWNKESLFTMMDDLIKITTELEEGRGTVIDTWGSGVLAIDSQGRPYLILEEEEQEKEEKTSEGAVIEEVVPATAGTKDFELTIDIGQDQFMIGDVIPILIQAKSEDEGEIFDLEVSISIEGEKQKSFVRMIEAGKVQEIEFIPEKKGTGEIVITASPIGSDDTREWRETFKIEETSKQSSNEEEGLLDFITDFQDLDISLDSLKVHVETEGLGHMIIGNDNAVNLDIVEEVKEEVERSPNYELLSEVVNAEIRNFGKKNRIRILNTSVVIDEAIHVTVWYEFGMLSKLKHFDNSQLSALLDEEIKKRFEAEDIECTLPLDIGMRHEEKKKEEINYEKLANSFDF